MARESIIPIRLTAEGADKVQAELGKATRGLNAIDAAVASSRTRLESYSHSLGAVGAAVSKLGVAGLAIGGIAAAGTAIFALTKNAAEAADAIYKASNALGISVKAYQEWAYAADLAGISQDQFNTGLKTFESNIGQLQAGRGRLLQFLQSYDASLVAQIKNQTDATEALSLFLDKIREAPNAFAQAALARSAFGELGSQMILLARAADEDIERFRAFGIAVSEDAAAKAEYMNDRLDDMEKVMSGKLSQALSHLYGTFGDLGFVISDATAKMLDFISSAEPESVERITAKIAALKTELERVNAQSNNSAIGFFSGLSASSIRDEIKELEKLLPITQALEDKAKNEAKAKKDAADASAAELDIERKRETAIKNAESARKQAESEHQSAVKDLERLESDAAKAGLDGIAALDYARQESYKKWEDLYNHNIITANEVARAQLAIDDKYLKDKAELEQKAAEKSQKQQIDIVVETTDQYATVFEHAAEGIQDSFTNTFRDMLDGGIKNFSDFTDSLAGIFKQMLAEMATLAIARPIIVPIVQSIGGATGAAGTGAALAGQFGGTGTTSTIPGIASLAPYAPILAALGAGAMIGGSVGGGGLGAYAGGAGGALAGGFGGILLASGSSSIGAALGSFAPVIGTIAGAVIGGAIGSLFGGGGGENLPDRSKIRFGISSAGGIIPTGENQGTPQSVVAQFHDLGEGYIKAAGKVVDDLGIKLTAQSLYFLTRSQQIRFRDAEGNLIAKFGEVGNRTGVPTKETITQASDFAVMQFVKQSAEEAGGAIGTAAAHSVAENLDALLSDLDFAKQLSAGTLFNPEKVNAAEQAIKDLNAALDGAADRAEALGLTFDRQATYEQKFTQLVDDFNTSIQDQIQAINAPLLAALAAEDKVAKDRLDNAKSLGANLVEVERLNALERQNIIEQTFAGIKNLADSLNLSQYSPLTPSQRLGTAQSLFDVTSAQAAAGNATAIGALPQVAQQLLAEGQSFYAGTKGFRDIFTNVNQTLNQLLQFGGSDPVVTSVDKLGRQSITNTAQLVDAINKVTAGNNTLSAQLQDVLDQVLRLLSARQAA